MSESTVTVDIRKFSSGRGQSMPDVVAVEEPLHIHVSMENATGRLQRHVGLTMRTPGHDAELAAGYLFTEGIIRKTEDIESISHSRSDINHVEVKLRDAAVPDMSKLSRAAYITSACGLCGKTTMADIITEPFFGYRSHRLKIKSELISGLQHKLRGRQDVFESTGGIHGAGLFSMSGELLLMMEDVGRHNALDKLIGAALLQGMLPLSDCVLLLSGRAGFELIQKAAMAGIPVVAAVGAPSSLAIEMAKEMRITLAGFVREDRFNVYHEFDELI